ncbi:MAG: 30S ribosomal protein S9 [Cytophagaceae bacterium]|jgi:small subunit ribosomal protein S9|nr:30S ribosomal protein S9 [Cytophagaceae bacterium]
MEVVNTIGRRKSSVARVYVKPGKGTITVNDRDLKVYFPSEILQTIVNQPLVAANEVGKYDIKATIDGGGLTGQAEALRLAITRALCSTAPESRTTLKKAGYVTRDPRMVERKKYGRRKARRRFQFSKR